MARIIPEQNNKKQVSLKQPDYRWYAAYTNPRAEKQVFKRLTEAGIETFLPLQRTKRKWSDRVKWVDRPLINSYIFIKIKPVDFPKVYKTVGVVKLITFEGVPVAIPEDQINNLRLLIDSDAEMEVTSERFDKGDLIEVIAGSLVGLRGELIRIGTKKRVIVRIDSLDHNIVVTIPSTFLKKYN